MSNPKTLRQIDSQSHITGKQQKVLYEKGLMDWPIIAAYPGDQPPIYDIPLF